MIKEYIVEFISQILRISDAISVLALFKTVDRRHLTLLIRNLHAPKVDYSKGSWAMGMYVISFLIFKLMNLSIGLNGRKTIVDTKFPQISKVCGDIQKLYRHYLKQVPTFIGFQSILGRSKNTLALHKTRYLFLSPFIGFVGGPIPPLLRKRRLWMAPKMTFDAQKDAFSRIFLCTQNFFSLSKNLPINDSGKSNTGFLTTRQIDAFFTNFC